MIHVCVPSLVNRDVISNISSTIRQKSKHIN